MIRARSASGGEKGNPSRQPYSGSRPPALPAVRVSSSWRLPERQEPLGSLRETARQADREDLVTIYRNMLVTRGSRSARHPVKAGQDPGRPSQGAGTRLAVGVATMLGREDVGTPLHATWSSTSPRRGAVAGSSPRTWPRGRPTKGADGNVHMADGTRADPMVQPPPAMLPVAVGAALAFRIREEKCVRGSTRRGRLRAP